MNSRVGKSLVQTDYLIIGAGPGGLQLGLFFKQKGMDYLILEKEASAGVFFKTYPRHRKLLSINKPNTGSDDPVFNLRMDWNSLLSDKEELRFTRYTEDYFPDAGDLQRYLSDFAEVHALRINYDTRVSEIAGQGEGFRIAASEGKTFECRRLIMATGNAVPVVPDIPGIELCRQYRDFDVDPEAYRNKRVLIIGKGNSAFETAESMAHKAASIHLCSPQPVEHAWKTHFVGHVRAVNNNMLDTYQLKSQNTILDADILRIYKKENRLWIDIQYTHSTTKDHLPEPRTIPFDDILVCAGFRFDASIFAESCLPELMPCGKYPLQKADFESVNLPGLYFAGTLMAQRDYRKTMSSFIHGFRHNIKAMVAMLRCKYHGESLPCRPVPSDPAALTRLVIDRLNREPAMFLQPGFIGDVFEFPEQGQPVLYPNQVLDYALEYFAERSGTIYAITLEYGPSEDVEDPFNIDRSSDPEDAPESKFLHPIFRKYVGGELKDVFHLLEDLENVYSDDCFRLLIEDYFGRQLKGKGERVALSL